MCCQVEAGRCAQLPNIDSILVTQLQIQIERLNTQLHWLTEYDYLLLYYKHYFCKYIFLLRQPFSKVSGLGVAACQPSSFCTTSCVAPAVRGGGRVVWPGVARQGDGHHRPRAGQVELGNFSNKSLIHFILYLITYIWIIKL